MEHHDCTYPEVLIEEADEGELKAGMRVLVPCPECGDTPADHMAWLDAHATDATDALIAAKPIMPLYHWSPRERRGQIIRYGLRPSMRSVTSSESFPVICFADAPSWAWALSGDMRFTPAGEWDLWQTSLDRLSDPVILPSDRRMSGVYEVRTVSRVWKRDLWWVGSRVKR